MNNNLQVFRNESLDIDNLTSITLDGDSIFFPNEVGKESNGWQRRSEKPCL